MANNVTPDQTAPEGQGLHYLPFQSAQAFPYKVHSREATQKASKREQPFLHATHRLDAIYMPTRYYQNISKGIKIIERTSFCLRTD